MRVVIGPVSTASALAWLDHAAMVVAAVDELAPATVRAAPDVPAVFADYVEQWERASAQCGTWFQWEMDRPPEVVQHHLHAFNRVAESIAERVAAGGRHWAWPAEGDAFYRAMLTGVLAALGREGGEFAAYATDTADRWPGLAAVSA